MDFFSSNIKLMRNRKGKTQDDVAFALAMKRSTLSGYENNVAQPSIQTLIAFSDYFNVAIDTLIRVDLSGLPESQLLQLERGWDVHIKGSGLRILATTVNSNNEDNIELVSEKAKAGYRSGFSDPEYIKVLPAFQLPFLSKNKKYRSFQVSGDSMLPIPHGSWVTGEYVENWQQIKDRKAYIILTLEDGIVFKVVENRIESAGRLRLYSLNEAYDPYDIDIRDVKEVWKFIHFISSEMPEGNGKKDPLLQEIQEIRKDIRAIQTRLDL